MNRTRSVSVALLPALAFAATTMAGADVRAATAATELTVYTAVEAEDLKRYAEAFNRDYPDITINWVRDSTLAITEKLLAERNAPKADAVWGLAATSVSQLKIEGLLYPYAPDGLKELSPNFRDRDEPAAWTGTGAWVASVCFNTVKAEKIGLPPPESWEDLTKPVYQGHVVMPNPNSSGTGFLDVSAWLQLFGEEDGWAYMDRLHENIAWYTHSGSKPCKQAAGGEIPIGISFAYRGATSKAKGAPLEIIVPSEGVGWDMEAAAIMAGTTKLQAARNLIDWSVSERANRLYGESFAVVAIPGAANPPEHFPDGITDAMIDNDFHWAARNRARILAEWQRRYDSKSETE